jgi:hypothetical protein
MTMNTEDNEWLFDAMAQAIDQVGPERSALLLAKFAMLLSNQIGERSTVEKALQSALTHLPQEPASISPLRIGISMDPNLRVSSWPLLP